MTGLFGKGSKNKETESIRSKKSELKKLVKDKKYVKILKIGSEILEKNPHDLDVLFVLGGLHYMNEKFSKAISYFDNCLEIIEFDPDSLLLKANSHYNICQYKKSFTCF